MIINNQDLNNKFNQTNITENKSILEQTPTTVALSIIKQLSIGDIVNCCKTTKGLKELASNDQLWEQTAKLLNIQTRNTTNYKSAVGSRVDQLKKDILVADPVVNEPVKNAYEFDMAYYSGDVTESLTNELNRKLELGGILEKGFEGHFFLKRIGMIASKKVEDYANKLQHSYSDDKPWTRIGLNYSLEKNYEKALEVIDTHLNKKSHYSSRNDILYNMIIRCLNNGKLNQAFTYFKKMKSYEGMETYHVQECIKNILSFSKEQNKNSIPLEMLEQGLIPEREQIYTILDLIQNHIKNHEIPKAKVLLANYAEELKKTNRCTTCTLIEIYVAVYDIKAAWKLTMENKGKDEVYLYILRNAFNKHNIPEEANKVESMIEK